MTNSKPKLEEADPWQTCPDCEIYRYDTRKDYERCYRCSVELFKLKCEAKRERDYQAKESAIRSKHMALLAEGLPNNIDNWVSSRP